MLTRHARSGPGGGAARGLPGALGVDESPDAVLAARVARRMVAEGMIAPADEAAVRDALAAGRPSKAEWRQWAEGDGVGAAGG